MKTFFPKRYILNTLEEMFFGTMYSRIDVFFETFNTLIISNSVNIFGKLFDE